MGLHDAPRALARTSYLGRLIVRSLTSGRETDRARRGSCTPIKVQKCAPCVPKPRPVCREPSAACPHGLRLICYPPSAGKRPPCDLPSPPPPLSCERNRNQVQSMKHTEGQSSDEHKNFCGAQLDRVAMRLAAAERLRRLDYEREVAEQTPPPAPVPAPYHLTSEHECLRAIDGRDYTVSKSSINTDKSTQNSTPPCPVKLKPVDKCEISRGHRLDPCEHHPRIFLEIDRSASNKSPEKLSYNVAKQNDESNAAGTSSPKQMSTTGRFTTRLLKSLKRNENTVCPRQACKSSSTEKSWCVNLSPPKSVPVSCREQSLLERLRQKPGSAPGKQCNPQRQLHSQICNEPTPKSNKGLEEKTKQDRLTSVLRERMHLKEAGRGRVVTTDQKSNKSTNFGSGGLELKVPPNSEAVRVRVSLDFETVDIATGKRNPAELKNFNDHAISTCHSVVGSESWLSIKNLQKKFSGYRKNDVSTENKSHGNYGTCQRPSDENTSILKKRPECTLPPRSQKPVVQSPHSNTPPLQRPRSQSPCTPYPKQSTSQYISQNILTTY
ncbi:uncharacterized protein LOC125077119 isoform X2 [Vanessa atalanta]|uniref:uncharacterized protein LOC125076707 isoform X1 n=1 Tax=Vanessa atalanta TaxID=42275 RepID=UPI001FCD35F7|nr:uncharacterized protein LOC125076707 isoform X1 [Vanessa atalanta]XP_047544885.1 uncharacterized protein LOC125077119 isoform X2 [Vanessa atalanta]